MMTGHGDVPSAVKALTRGATDFIEKPFSDELLFQSVERAVAISLDRFQRNVRHERALSQLSCLSAREFEVLRGLVAGMTNKEMARALKISHRTVEMHRANMMRDLECASATEVMRLAIEANITPLQRAGVDQSEAPTS
jgi:two-component system response regulator FixJ